MTMLLLLLGAAALVALLIRLRGSALTLTLAGLAFGAAGYVLAGSPSVPASPASERAKAAPLPLTAARRAFFGQVVASEYWAIMAEGYASRGDTAKAAQVYRAALRERPDNYQLWTLYANALVDHGGGLNPAAELAFDRAQYLRPRDDGVIFFRALAEARSGRIEDARARFDLLATRNYDDERAAFIAGALATFNNQSTGS